MRNNTDFISLHNHTEFSNFKLTDSIIKTQDLLDYTNSLGNKGVAITDHNIISAHIGAINHVIKQKDSGVYPKDFKLILGNEIYLVDEDEMSLKIQNKERVKFYHFILLAKDEVGYKQIRELSAKSWERAFSHRGLVRTPNFYKDFNEIIGNDRGHVIASTACFLEGAQVLTKEGLRNIENIKAGDMVLNMNGEYEMVNFPTSRQYEGRLISFKTEGGAFEIESTDNHKYLTLETTEGYDEQYVEELLGECFVTKGNYFIKQRMKQRAINYKLKWKEAKDFKTGEYLLTPIDKRVVDKDFIELEHDGSNHEFLKYKKDGFFINSDFLEILGLYLADGSATLRENRKGNDRIIFSLNRDNKMDLVKKVQDYFTKEGFQCGVYYKKEGRGVDVSIASKLLAHNFVKWFGKNALEKDVPKFVKLLPPEKQMYFFKGYVRGDGYCRFRIGDKGGCEESRSITVASVSKNMTQSIINILYRNNINPNLTEHEEKISKDGTHHCKSYYLDINGKKVNSLYEFIYENKQYSLKNNLLLLKDIPIKINGVYYMTQKIKSIKTREYKGVVHCLNVGKTHSFICEGVIVHNCLGGFLATTILKTQEDKNACNETYDFLDWCIDMFGEDDIYLEMQPSILEYDEDNNEIFNEQKFVNERIVKIAEVYNLKTIITTDAHYLKEEDSKIHEAFLNSDEEGSSHREVAKFYQTTYVMETSKFYELMPYLGEDIIDKCIDNSMGIWGKITSDVTYNMFHTPKIPLTPVPNKVEWYRFDTTILEKYPNMKQLWSGDNIQESYLISQLFRGINEWDIKDEKLLETLNRLEEECEIITGYNKNNNTHVGSYFTTMQVLIDVIWEEANALVGAGRGSGVGFLINRLLGITQINPLNYGILLPPWRFLTPDVKSMPKQYWAV